MTSLFLQFKINEFGHMEMITEEFEFEPMETSTGDFDNQDEFGSGLGEININIELHEGNIIKNI